MKKFLKSFLYAFRGIYSGLRERNFRVEVVGAILVIIFGIWLKISSMEWIIMIALVGLVLAAELINTAVEEICNKLRDDLGLSYFSTQRARDVAAGAVLVIAMASLIVAIMVFVPKMLILIPLL